jgi:hypothetical protein
MFRLFLRGTLRRSKVVAPLVVVASICVYHYNIPVPGPVDLLPRSLVCHAEGKWSKSFWSPWKYVFDNGVIYEGSYHTAITEGAHGAGKLTFPNGDCYEGEFSHFNKPDGKGKFTKKSTGECWEGEFQLGIPSGIIKYTHSDGYVFEGEYRNGKRSGKGKYKTADGIVFEGSFQNGLRHGFGKETGPDGSYYEGDFLNGVPHGQGKQKEKNGGFFEGELKEGKKDGRGKYTYPSGNVFEGEFRSNVQYNGKLWMKSNDSFVVARNGEIVME